MVFSDVYLQPEAPDPVLGEEVVVAAARRHVPEAGGLLEVDESGGEARAYFLEGGIVMKTQRPHRLRPRTSLRKEALFLAELERQGDFPVPRALGHGEMDGIEYLCLTRVEGRAVEHVSLEADKRAALLGELGRTLRAIHEIEQSVLAASGLFPGDNTPADLTVRFQQAFDRLASTLSADPAFAAAVDLRGVAERCVAQLPTEPPLVALHSNPGPEHTFAEPATGAFVGLIDFGDAYRSHPALDLRPWPEAGDAEALLAGYRSAGPLSSGFEEVRLAGLVMMEMARAARGRRSPDELSSFLDRVLA